MRIFFFILIFSKVVTCIGQSPISYTIFVSSLPTCSTCCDGVVCVTSPTGGCGGGYTADWSGGNTSPASCSPNIFCYNTTYTICVYDFCDTTCKVFTFPSFSGVIEHSKKTRLVIYPNPVSNALFILAEENEIENSSVEIINAIGQIVCKTDYSINIPVSDLPKGLYFLNIETHDKRKLKSKFIKE